MAFLKQYLRTVGGNRENTFNISFESGEQGDYPVYFPMPVMITKIIAVPYKTIAGTDAATITGANSVGSSTGGVVTFAAGTAVGLASIQTATPTTNNTVTAAQIAAGNGYYKLTTAKTTAGGKVTVTIHYKTQ